MTELTFLPRRRTEISPQEVPKVSESSLSQRTLSQENYTRQKSAEEVRIQHIRRELEQLQQHEVPMVTNQKNEEKQIHPSLKPEQLKKASRGAHMLGATLEVFEATEAAKLIGITFVPHIGALISIVGTGLEVVAERLDQRTYKQKPIHQSNV